MDNIRVEQKTSEWSRSRRRKKLWQRVLAGMMAVVVFSTTYALILPAITKEQAVFCGLEEHKHEESCYERVLICGYPAEEEGASMLLGGSQLAHAYEGEPADDGEPADGEPADGEPAAAPASDDAAPVPSDATQAQPVAEEEEEGGSGAAASDNGEAAGGSEAERASSDEAPAPAAERHVHTEACYVQRLACGHEEHAHSEACFSDAEADLETEEIWARSVADVELSGVWADDVVAIAKSQLGQGESERNYIVDENGAKQGYTRFGAWWGAPYEPWCAMFVSFVLNYAGVPEEAMPRDAGCLHWQGVLQEQGLWRPTEGYTPKAGDVVFFDFDGNYQADHVGLVYALEQDEDGAITKITTIEGNNSTKVETFTYAPDDTRILGYGVLPENPDKPQSEQAEGLAARALADGQAVLVAETEDGVVATLTADPAYLPYPIEELTLVVTPVEDEAAEALIDSRTETAAGTVREILLFDIKILHGDEEVQPLGPVTVRFSGVVARNDDAQVFHVDPAAATAEEVTAEGVEEDEVAMVAEHFSFYGVTYTHYTVDFHYNNNTVSIEGKSSIRLSELFALLELDYDAAEAVLVSFTDESLVRVERLEDEDDWLLVSLAPFDTEEELSVTFSTGEILSIPVTDGGDGGGGDGGGGDSGGDSGGDPGCAVAGVDGNLSACGGCSDGGYTVVQYGHVYLKKVDPQGKPVVGARFKLTVKGTNGKTYTNISIPAEKNGVNLKDGYYWFLNVPKFAAEYTITETVVPSGYQKASPKKFTVKTWNQEWYNAGTMVDKKTVQKGNVVIYKVDENGRPMTTAKFTLTGKDVNGDKFTINSVKGQYNSTTGGYDFKNVPVGTGNYTVTETVAPYGYQKASPITFPASRVKAGQWYKHTTKIVNKPIPPETAKLWLTKLDNETQQKLVGAQFAVYRLTTNKGVAADYYNYTGTRTKIATSVDHGDGTYELHYDIRTAPENKRDTYYLVETKTPAGYEASCTYHDSHFGLQHLETVWVEGTTKHWSSEFPSDSNGWGRRDIYNYPIIRHRVIVNKKGDDGKPLSGAVFRVYGSRAGKTTESGIDETHKLLATLAYQGNGRYAADVIVPAHANPPPSGQKNAYWLQLVEESAPRGYTKTPLASYSTYPAINPENTEESQRYGFADIVAYDIDDNNKVWRVRHYESGARDFFNSTTLSDAVIDVQYDPGDQWGVKGRTEFTIVNAKIKPGTLKFRKWGLLEADPNNRFGLEGAQFELSGYSSITGESFTISSVDDGDGWYHFDNVPVGAATDVYKNTEIRAPMGYGFTSAGFEIAGNRITSSGEYEDTEHYYHNVFRSGVMQFKKVDAYTREPILNAEFTMTGTSHLVPGQPKDFTATSTHVGGGIYEFENIPEGLLSDKYTVTETEVPDGYLACEPFSVAGNCFVPANGTYYYAREVADSPKGAKLVIAKLGSDASMDRILTGAEFELRGTAPNGQDWVIQSHREEDCGENIHDELNGELHISGIPVGTADDVYYLYETKAPTGYTAISEPIKLRGDWFVRGSSILNVTANDLQNFNPGLDGLIAAGEYNGNGIFCVINRSAGGTLRFNKIGKLNGEPLTGAEFTISGTSNASGTAVPFGPISATEIDPVDQPGFYEFQNVPVGLDTDVYTVTETRTPSGYTPVSFTVAGDTVIDGDSVTLQDVEDPAATTTLYFNKVDKSNGDAPLSGAVFTMTGTSSIHGDFTLTSTQPDPVNNPGLYAIEQVLAGDAADVYTITEKQPPAGYAAAADFTVTWADFLDANNEVTDYSYPTNIEDEKRAGVIQFRKVSAVTGEPVLGAGFTMSYNGSDPALAAQFPLTSVEVDPDNNPGLYEFQNVPEGLATDSYTITETDPPLGYKPCEPFTVAGNVCVDGTYTYTDPNSASGAVEDPVTGGTLKFKKVGSDVGNPPLLGAEFEMSGTSSVLGDFTLTSVDLYQESVDAGAPDDSLKGYYEIRDVPYDVPVNGVYATYTIDETVVPSGYYPCEPIELTWAVFTENNGAYVCTLADVTDERTSYSLTVTKTVVDGPAEEDFPFTATIKNSVGYVYTWTEQLIRVYDAEGNEIGDSVGIDDETGEISTTLRAGWKFVIEGLDTEHRIVVAEDTPRNYSVTIRDEQNNDLADPYDPAKTQEITINGDRTVAFTNTGSVTNLKVKKTTQDHSAEKFPFELNFPLGYTQGLNAKLYDAQDQEITDASRAPVIDFDTDQVRFALADGEYLLLTDVPLGAEVTLKETQHEGYDVTIKDLSSGPVQDGDFARIAVSNTTLHEIEVVNNPGFNLPHTGGMGTFLNTLGGTALMGLTTLLWLGGKRRRRGEA